MYINWQHGSLWNYFYKKNSNVKKHLWVPIQNSYPGFLKFNFPPKRLGLILWDIVRPAGMAPSRVANLFCDRRPCQRLGWKTSRETFIVKGLPFFPALDPFCERNQGPDETQLSQGAEEVRGCVHVQITLFLMPKITALKRHESGITSMWSILCFRPRSFRRFSNSFSNKVKTGSKFKCWFD